MYVELQTIFLGKKLDVGENKPIFLVFMQIDADQLEIENVQRSLVSLCL